MQHVEAIRIIARPPEALWPLISDVVAVQRWHPSVERAELLSPKPNGLGAARRCHFYDGTNVREEVVKVEDGRSVRMALSEFSVPMTRLEAEFQLIPNEQGRTEAHFGLHYVVKFGAFGRLLGATVMRGQLRKMAAKVLAGLEHHATTGELVGKDFVAQAA